MFDVCWICHLTIDLSNDRTFTVLRDDEVTYATPGLCGVGGFPNPSIYSA